MRPRFRARRKIPDAARAESKYLSGADGSRTSASDGAHEHPSAPLGHSEVLRVEYPPGHAIPEFDQRVDDRGEVHPLLATKEPRDVFHEYGPRSNSIDDTSELEEQAGAFTCEPCASSCDGYVLAGEPAAERITFIACELADIRMHRHPWEVQGKDATAPFIRFAEESVPPAGTGEPEVEPADSREQ